MGGFVLQPAPIQELVTTLLAAAEVSDASLTTALRGFAAWEFGKVSNATETLVPPCSLSARRWAKPMVGTCGFNTACVVT
jgi:hypothetical protein